MIQCIDSVFILSSDCFSHLLFIKQLKCCGLVNGASDWGSNFQHYYRTCECPSESDSSCTKYSGKTIYKQVRTNPIWHSKWFCYFIHNENLYKILNFSNYKKKSQEFPWEIKNKSFLKDKSRYKRIKVFYFFYEFGII